MAITGSGTVKTVVPIGLGVLAQQVIEPFSPSVFQSLGTFSIVAVASYHIIKYLVGQNEKKDDRIFAIQDSYVAAIQKLHGEQIAANAAHTVMLVEQLRVVGDELRESRNSRERLTEVLKERASAKE